MNITLVCFCLATLLNTGCSLFKKRTKTTQAKADFERKVRCSEAAVRAEHYLITRNSEVYSTIDNFFYSAKQSLPAKKRYFIFFNDAGLLKDDFGANTPVVGNIVDPLSLVS